MKIMRAVQALRREGFAGLAARLRHGRADHRAAALAPVAASLQIKGEDAAQLAAVLTALHQVGFAATATQADMPPSAEGGAAALRIVAHGVRLDMGWPGSVLVPDAVPAPELVAMLAVWADRVPGRAILITSTAAFGALRAAGVSPDRMLILPPLDGSADLLAAGLLRWLVAARAVQPAELRPAAFPSLRTLRAGDALCLSLPETPARRRAFLDRHPDGFVMFDGLRLVPGWQGAAQSYRLIARAALERGAVPLIVCEDDVELSPDYPDRLGRVLSYLDGCEWDVFSGLVTNLAQNERHPRAVHHDGMVFVHMGQTIGMVFNIYNRRALERLAAWSPAAGGLADNSIDAWLGAMPGLRVVTTLPFLAGHRGELQSSIFGFSNHRYDSMIRASENLLARRVGVSLSHGRSDRSGLIVPPPPARRS